MQQFLGDVYAVQGKFTEAARVYKKIGQQSRAMTMYTDLRMFDLAKVLIHLLTYLLTYLASNYCIRKFKCTLLSVSTCPDM